MQNAEPVQVSRAAGTAPRIPAQRGASLRAGESAQSAEMLQANQETLSGKNKATDIKLANLHFPEVV